MVDVLTTKIHAWEKEREKEFTYDGVGYLNLTLLSWTLNSFVFC